MLDETTERDPSTESESPTLSMWVPGEVSASEAALAALADAGGTLEATTQPHLLNLVCPPGWKIEQNGGGFPLPTPIVDALGRVRAMIYWGDHGGSGDSLTILYSGDEETTQ